MSVSKAHRDLINRELHDHAAAIIYGHEQTALELAICCAIVEQESGGANIFGCDLGQGVAFCHQPVTKTKVAELLASSYSNGVGLTQLTYKPFVVEADHLGGAEKPRYQCVVGFRLMASLIKQYGEGGMWHYNGSPTYQAQIGAKVATWRSRL